MILFAIRLPGGRNVLSAGLYDAHPLRVLALWFGARCITWRMPA